MRCEILQLTYNKRMSAKYEVTKRFCVCTINKTIDMSPLIASMRRYPLRVIINGTCRRGSGVNKLAITNEGFDVSCLIAQFTNQRLLSFIQVYAHVQVLGEMIDKHTRFTIKNGRETPIKHENMITLRSYLLAINSI